VRKQNSCARLSQISSWQNIERPLLKCFGSLLLFFIRYRSIQLSTMPLLVSQSTCEAESCMASFCVMAGLYIKKVLNEILGHYSDRPLTILVGTNSQSAMDTANSRKETNRTRHIARRFHFVRHCIGNGMTTLFKVPGNFQSCQLSNKAAASTSTTTRSQHFSDRGGSMRRLFTTSVVRRSDGMALTRYVLL
jgi:hypothetical protein